MMDAALPRWGFVILRTAYGMEGDDCDCSDAVWQCFHNYFKQTGNYAMGWWKGGSELWPTHESVVVSDREALDGADTAALRARMRAMREAGQIPEGVCRDVFLVADRNVFCNEQFAQAMSYTKARAKGTIYLRAVDPNHDPSVQPVHTEGPYAGFDGEIKVSLPKVFDWAVLHLLCRLRVVAGKILGDEDQGLDIAVDAVLAVSRLRLIISTPDDGRNRLYTYT